MKNRLHELDLGGGDWNNGSGGGNDWNTGDGNDGGNKPQTPKTPDNGGNKKRKNPVDNKVCINKVQNLLKELNPSFNVSGSMDANTLIEIMNKLNELETPSTVTNNDVAVIPKTKNLPTFDITDEL